MRSSNERIFFKKLFCRFQRVNPTIVQVDTQSKYMAFPSHRKDFCQQKIPKMNMEVLGVETSPGWHHVDDVKCVNFPNHCQHDLSRTKRLTHPRWDLISRCALFC
jgi:hypothetical protein